MFKRTLILLTIIFLLPAASVHAEILCERFLMSFSFTEEFAGSTVERRIAEYVNEPPDQAVEHLTSLAAEIRTEIDRVSQHYKTASSLFRRDFTYRQRLNPFCRERCAADRLFHELKNQWTQLETQHATIRQHIAYIEDAEEDRTGRRKSSQVNMGDGVSMREQAGLSGFGSNNDFSGGFSSW